MLSCALNSFVATPSCSTPLSKFWYHPNGLWSAFPPLEPGGFMSGLAGYDHCPALRPFSVLESNAMVRVCSSPCRTRGNSNGPMTSCNMAVPGAQHSCFLMVFCLLVLLLYCDQTAGHNAAQSWSLALFETLLAPAENVAHPKRSLRLVVSLHRAATRSDSEYI